MNKIAAQAVCFRQVGVHFEDEPVRRIQYPLGSRRVAGKTEITVTVHGRNGHHDDIDRCQPAAVVFSQLAVLDRCKIGMTFIDIASVHTAAVPRMIGKRHVMWISFHYFRPFQTKHTTDFYVLQFSCPLCQCLIQNLGKGYAVSIIDPVPVADQLHRPLRCTTLTPVFAPIIHLLISHLSGTS